jgi:hypothetical protein
VGRGGAENAANNVNTVHSSRGAPAEDMAAALCWISSAAQNI